MKKILRINMSGSKGPELKHDSIEGYEGLGGRAMTSSVVAREVPPLCHPLSAENKLVIAPGLMSGTAAVMSGRLSIGCKSPLTGTIKEANAGGQAALMLAKLGYAAIILEGKPLNDNLYKIVINKDNVLIEPDNSLKLLGNYELISKMNAAHGNKVCCISIGQTGEMKMSAASIAITDKEQRPTRHAARGGVGAVMGAKGVKPAYDPRTVQGIGVTYATSTMGADHTSGYAVATNLLSVGGQVDPLKPEGQVELSRNLQISTAAIDATGMCLFIAFPILDQPETFQALLDLINSFHGMNMNSDDVMALGKTILKNEKDFNTRAGFISTHDRLPGFFKKESVSPHNITFNVPDEALDDVLN
ncbi:MAG: hypothetical protein OMM_03720 [Candidatus Magnetoglobus multicellularis str. Araruama]|uniref:Aldehyde ferredoxin oxidoreductase N-terminal domain-containing protein n=1 Tax=Candidatus Magnetoglobus multicellularis str. Araruama TaxID=890399 RepID=A0A1V1P4K0_9BACT|nr:MAG: hypothetical protein OMM_03720 [Candidatus Magnetoglobus multicellularis str. Araruama]